MLQLIFYVLGAVLVAVLGAVIALAALLLGSRIYCRVMVTAGPSMRGDTVFLARPVLIKANNKITRGETSSE